IVMVRRVLVWLIKSAERRGPEPGASLDLLPEAPLPADLRWAAGNAVIAQAYARGTAAIEGAGRHAVPPEVRELVLEHLSGGGGRAGRPGRRVGRGRGRRATRGPAPGRPPGPARRARLVPDRPAGDRPLPRGPAGRPLADRPDRLGEPRRGPARGRLDEDSDRGDRGRFLPPPARSI